jgi:signal transduction histidine kinase
LKSHVNGQYESRNSGERITMIYKTFLGEILIQKGFVTREQIHSVLQKQKEARDFVEPPENLPRSGLISESRLAEQTMGGVRLGELLVYQGLVTEAQISEAVVEQTQTATVLSNLDCRKLAAVMEVGIVVGSTLNLSKVLNLIMDFATQVTGSEASTLMLIDENTGELVFSVPTGPKSEQLTDVRLPPGQGIAGWVAMNESSLLVPDVSKEPLFYQGVDKDTGFETKSILAIPLKTNFKLIGVLEVINKQYGEVFTPEDELFLSFFGYMAAMAIENARLYRELHERMEHDIAMEKNLAEAEKLRSLGLMASGIAHNFNNTLTVILGNSELLEGASLSKNSAQRVSVIKKASMEGAEIVERLLTFTRSKSLNSDYATVVINQLVEDAIKMTEPIWRAKAQHKGINITIHQHLSPENLKVHGNEGALKEVLVNIIFNAIDAMPNGGGIDISTYREVSRVCVCISDSGTGISEEDKRRIFDPFFTTKDPPNTGLGMSLAFGIVNSHNGSIEVKSWPGKGTTFMISLPLSNRADQTCPPPEKSSVQGKPCRVLVIDDEEAIVDFICEALEALGHYATGANSGQAGIEIHSSGDYDLVITDLAMPGMSGWEVLAKVRDSSPGVKVGLMSGWDLSEDELSQKGVDFMLRKPFSIKHISATLNQALAI